MKSLLPYRGQKASSGGKRCAGRAGWPSHEGSRDPAWAPKANQLRDGLTGRATRPVPLRFLVRALADLPRQLPNLLRNRGAEALHWRLVAVHTKLSRQLIFVEQVVVAGRFDRHCGLDRERAVVLQAGRGGGQLADDDVLLEANEFVPFALECRIGEHLGGLLEGGRGKERLGRQRGLGDPEDDLLAFGRGTAIRLDLFVESFERTAVFELAGQQAGRALRLDFDLLQHLPGNQLDVLVVDVNALCSVDLLHLGDEVELGVGATADRQQVGRVERALVELLADLDFLAIGDVQAGTGREAVGMLLAARLGDDHFQRFVGFLDRDLAGLLSHLRQTLRFTRLEELDDARYTLGDVLA